MTVQELQKILEVLPKDTDVMIEYMPRPHEFISEYAFGVRAEDDRIVVFGVTEAG